MKSGNPKIKDVVNHRFLPLHQVILCRTDNQEELKCVPLSISEIKYATETSEFFSRIRRGTCNIVLDVTDEIREYMKRWQATGVPKYLQVIIQSFFTAFSEHKDETFIGYALQFPEPRKLTSNDDTITLSIGDITSTWETAENFINEQSAAFNNVSVLELLEELLDYAGMSRGSQGITVPQIEHTEKFWSAINRPRPDRVDDSRPYDNTAQVQAIDKNDYLQLLYLGVKDEIHTFNPAAQKDEYDLLVQIKPRTNIKHPDDVTPEYNIEYLEYDKFTGLLRGIVGTTHTDLLTMFAHTKFHFTVAHRFIKWKRFTEILLIDHVGGSSTGDTVQVDISALTDVLPSKDDIRIGYSDGEYLTELSRVISGNFVKFELQENVDNGETVREKYWIFWDNADAGSPPTFVPGAVVDTFIYGDLDYLNTFNDIHITDGGNKFYLFNKGIEVKSKHLYYHNYGELKDLNDDPTEEEWEKRLFWWDVQAIGTPVLGTKESGVPKIATDDRLIGALVADTKFGKNQFDIGFSDLTDVPKVGRLVEIHNETTDTRQDLGKIIKVQAHSDFYRIETQYYAMHDYCPRVPTPIITVHIYPADILPTNNLLIMKQSKIIIQYDKDEISDYEIYPVSVERRSRKYGIIQYVYPSKVAELSDGQEIELPVGYYSFTSAPEAEEVYLGQRDDIDGEDDVALYYYKNDFPSSFSIILPGNKPAYCLRKHLIVHNPAPVNSFWERTPYNELLYRNSPVWNTFTGPMTSRGDIFLSDTGEEDIIYIAWNDISEVPNSDGTFYQVCHLGEVRISNDTTADIVRTYQDRSVYDLNDEPAYEITGYKVADGKHFGSRKMVKRNWIKTGCLVGLAMPSQIEDPDYIPEEYLIEHFAGDLAFACLVRGDRTDIADAADTIRLGSMKTGDASPKEYIISEAQALTRRLELTDILIIHGREIEYNRFVIGDWQRDFSDYFTLYLAIGVTLRKPLKGETDEELYEAIVLDEILGSGEPNERPGKYLSVAKGMDKRHQLWYKPSDLDWQSIYEIAPWYSEPEEGKEIDYYEELAHGEELTVEYDEGHTSCPRLILDNKRIITNSIIAIIEDGFIELEPVDYTDNTGDMPDVPDKYQIFIQGKQGSDYDETYVFLHPDLLGKGIKIDYQYYPDNAGFVGFVMQDNLLYVNEIGKNKWLKIDLDNPTDTPVNTYSPRVGDTSLYSQAVLLNDTIYAILEPSFLLAQFSEKFSGYIDAEVGNDDSDLFDILGYLARAVGAIAFCAYNKVIFYPRDMRDDGGTLTDVSDIQIRTTLPYKAVELGYQNGYARIGGINLQQNEIYKTQCPFIQSKGHAEIIAGQLAELFLNTRYVFEIEEQKFNVFAEPLDLKILPAEFLPEDLRPKSGGIPLITTEVNLTNGVTRYKLYRQDEYSTKLLPTRFESLQAPQR